VKIACLKCSPTFALKANGTCEPIGHNLLCLVCVRVISFSTIWLEIARVALPIASIVQIITCIICKNGFILVNGTWSNSQEIIVLHICKGPCWVSFLLFSLANCSVNMSSFQKIVFLGVRKILVHHALFVRLYQWISSWFSAS